MELRLVDRRRVSVCLRRRDEDDGVGQGRSRAGIPWRLSWSIVPCLATALFPAPLPGSPTPLPLTPLYSALTVRQDCIACGEEVLFLGMRNKYSAIESAKIRWLKGEPTLMLGNVVTYDEVEGGRYEVRRSIGGRTYLRRQRWRWRWRWVWGLLLVVVVLVSVLEEARTGSAEVVPCRPT